MRNGWIIVSIVAALILAAMPARAADPECAALVKYRDTDLFAAFDAYRRDYEKFANQHEVFKNLVDDLDGDWSATKAKAVQFWDAMTLTLQVTVQTVLAVMPANPTKVVHVVQPGNWRERVARKALEDAVNRARTAKGEKKRVDGDLGDVVRDAAVGKSPSASEVIQGAFKSLQIVQTLINAGERMRDRADGIKTFENSVREAEKALADVRRNLDAVVKQTNFVNEIRKDIDRKCGGVTARELKAYVDDAKHCIEIGRDYEYKSDKKRKRYLANRCDTSVIVFWCIDGAKKSVQCTDTKYYAKWWKLKPDDPYFSSGSLPTDKRVEFGACYGSYKNVTFTKDGSGDYGCLP